MLRVPRLSQAGHPYMFGGTPAFAPAANLRSTWPKLEPVKTAADQSADLTVSQSGTAATDQGRKQGDNEAQQQSSRGKLLLAKAGCLARLQHRPVCSCSGGDTESGTVSGADTILYP